VIRLIVAAAAAAAVLVASRPGGPADAALAHEQGRAIYNYRCYFCHGYSGDAKTVAAGLLARPPAAFIDGAPGTLTTERVVETLLHGRPGTAMATFRGTLTPREMSLVARFVVEEFAARRAANTRYHTADNGWPDHERFRDAFLFVRDPAALHRAPEELTEAESRGRRLYLSTCISCHETGAKDDAVAWDARPVSYPMDGHDCVSCHDRSRYPERGLVPLPPPASYHGAAGLVRPSDEASASAESPYSVHDQPVALAGATPQQERGQALYLRNCAFCHAADGTAKHWIGRFLEPHPRDLTDPAFRASLSREELERRIEAGLPGTAMPTWRNVLKQEEIGAIAAYIEGAFGRYGAARR
jgi:cytochrome c oxidase cbb3-type subunit 3